MKQARMQFSSFLWPVNPSVVTVKSGTRTASHTLPYGGDNSEPMGGRQRVAEGSGVFFGEDARDQLERLRQTAAKVSADWLYLPGAPPMRAVLEELDMVQQPQPDTVAYTFRFVEQRLPTEHGQTSLRMYTAHPGESLWHIAAKTGTTVPALLLCNPLLAHPWAVEEGQEVRLPWVCF